MLKINKTRQTIAEFFAIEGNGFRAVLFRMVPKQVLN